MSEANFSPLPGKKSADPKDLAGKLTRARGKPSAASKAGDKDLATGWADRSSKPAETAGTEFTKPYSTKVDPKTISRFNEVVKAKGMKKTAALDQAIRLWLSENEK